MAKKVVSIFTAIVLTLSLLPFQLQTVKADSSVGVGTASEQSNTRATLQASQTVIHPVSQVTSEDFILVKKQDKSLEGNELLFNIRFTEQPEPNYTVTLSFAAGNTGNYVNQIKNVGIQNISGNSAVAHISPQQLAAVNLPVGRYLMSVDGVNVSPSDAVQGGIMQQSQLHICTSSIVKATSTSKENLKGQTVLSAPLTNPIPITLSVVGNAIDLSRDKARIVLDYYDPADQVKYSGFSFFIPITGSATTGNSVRGMQTKMYSATINQSDLMNITPNTGNPSEPKIPLPNSKYIIRVELGIDGSEAGQVVNGKYAATTVAVMSDGSTGPIENGNDIVQTAKADDSIYIKNTGSDLQGENLEIDMEFTQQPATNLKVSLTIKGYDPSAPVYTLNNINVTKIAGKFGTAVITPQMLASVNLPLGGYMMAIGNAEVKPENATQAGMMQNSLLHISSTSIVKATAFSATNTNGQAILTSPLKNQIKIIVEVAGYQDLDITKDSARMILDYKDGNRLDYSGYSFNLPLTGPISTKINTVRGMSTRTYAAIISLDDLKNLPNYSQTGGGTISPMLPEGDYLLRSELSLNRNTSGMPNNNKYAATSIPVMAGIGTGPIAANYVTIAPINGGTILANPWAAAAGTTVSLIITPNTGRYLKEGSLKYNDGTSDFYIQGNTFIMPSKPVTISAEFESILVTGIKLNKTATQIQVGKSESLFATITPNNAANKTLTWSSSNTSVATVNGFGRVSAMGTGTATITATTVDGGKIATCDVTTFAPVVVPVEGIALNKTATQLIVGKSETLTTTVNPYNATNDAVIWSSDKSEIVTVDAYGKITAVKPGTAIITATSIDGEKSATCTVTVPVPVVPVTSVTLNKDTAIVEMGKTETLVAKINPDNASNKTLTWSSSDTTVATVDNTGKVTPIKAGSTVITVTTANTKKDTCTITVVTKIVPVTDVKLNKRSLTLEVGEAETLIATTNPKTATNKKVTWSSDKASVATVDSTGTIKAIAVGKANITVTTVDRKKTETCEVTVVKATSSNDGFTLNREALKVSVGKSDKLTPKFDAPVPTDKAVTWSSSKKDIATVTPSGVVKGLKPGTTVITATAADGRKATCTVTVVVSVKSVTLSKKTLSLAVDGSSSLTVKINPTNATNKSVKWSSSDEKVATVSDTGQVKALKAGTAIIKVTSVDGNKIATCRLTVTAAK